jgi:hypothetical protein
MQIIISSLYIFLFLNYYDLTIFITSLTIVTIYLLIILSYNKFERKNLIISLIKAISHVKRF